MMYGGWVAMCRTLSLLFCSIFSTLLSRLLSVIWLLLDRALYLAFCSSSCSWSISIMSCCMLYLLDMYMMIKNTTNTMSHICRRITCAVRMSPPKIFLRVKLDDRGASSSMACLAMASLNDSSCSSSSAGSFESSESCESWGFCEAFVSFASFAFLPSS